MEGVLKGDTSAYLTGVCCEKATEAQELLGLDFQSLFLKYASYFQGLKIKRLSE